MAATEKEDDPRGLMNFSQHAFCPWHESEGLEIQDGGKMSFKTDCFFLSHDGNAS